MRKIPYIRLIDQSQLKGRLIMADKKEVTPENPFAGFNILKGDLQDIVAPETTEVEEVVESLPVSADEEAALEI